ncbi:MAG: phage tail tape measure protein [Candidatus Coatesbacteria bacterium]|nr:MAG: phage tail tape measure protein [Candidatus Coatesbacteria bacterium]
MPLTPINVPLRIEGQDATGPAVRGLNNVARAGERAQAAIGGVGVTANQMSRAMDNARRAAFRYTYYALIALRAGQMLLAAGMQRFFIEPTREAEEAIVRFAALSDEARGRIEEITEAAIEFAMRTPYAIADAAKAMENLYRTGRSVKEAMEEAYDAANLAVISGRELATEATFLGEIMNVFARTGITATQVVDELAYAMTQSKYTIPELQAALENAMSVAIGFNQTFEQTIALITAFGRAGVPARQAGNMLRRIFARMGMPKVNEFFMTLTEAWNEMNAAAIEAGKTLPAQLYTAEGKFGDLSRAVIASA